MRPTGSAFIPRVHGAGGGARGQYLGHYRFVLFYT